MWGVVCVCVCVCVCVACVCGVVVVCVWCVSAAHPQVQLIPGHGVFNSSCTQVHMYMYMHVRMYVCMYVHACTYVCMYILFTYFRFIFVKLSSITFTNGLHFPFNTSPSPPHTPHPFLSTHPSLPLLPHIPPPSPLFPHWKYPHWLQHCPHLPQQ